MFVCVGVIPLLLIEFGVVRDVFMRVSVCAFVWFDVFLFVSLLWDCCRVVYVCVFVFVSVRISFSSPGADRIWP